MILIVSNSTITTITSSNNNSNKYIAASSNVGSSAKWQNIIQIYIVEDQELDNKRAKLLNVGQTTG